MLNQFLNYIRKEHLIAAGQQVLLAVSGGRDSVVMADLMARAGQAFAIAHCNFHLRPGDCDRDEQFVRGLAEGYGVRCFVAQFDTEAYAQSHKLSVEEAARVLRYDFFEKVRMREGFDWAATAHHRDDATETFFINLLRGTGIAGLHGIRPRNGYVIRPMLCFGREDIDRYVQRRGVAFVEDSTNAQPIYLRNRIRQQLIPLLRDLSSSFDMTMQDTMEHLREAELIYRDAVEQQRRQLLHVTSTAIQIDIKGLRCQPALSTLLFELLRPYGFSSAVTAQIVDSLDGQSGLQFFSPTHKLIKDRDVLLVVPLDATAENSRYTVEASCEALTEPLSLQMERLDVENAVLKVPCSVACFDYDRLRFPLHLRHWQRGDRFQPYGMNGTRLVSDLFTDAKLSREAKSHSWLLCDAEDRILWVVGLRAAAVAVVTRSTKQVYRITLKNS